MSSLGRLALGFVVGVGIALPLGIAIALNRHVADTLKPLLTFLQSIAGIAWVPLAIIWFGIGIGSVVFVIANTIFFATLYNAMVGVQSIPQTLHRAVRTPRRSGLAARTVLIIPGALVQLIVGFRTAMAYGWRALVAGEMIAGTDGLGYMTIEAVQWYRTETVLVGMIVIGLDLAGDGPADLRAAGTRHGAAVGHRAAMTIPLDRLGLGGAALGVLVQPRRRRRRPRHHRGGLAAPASAPSTRSPLYGGGLSEERLGRGAVRERPGRLPAVDQDRRRAAPTAQAAAPPGGVRDGPPTSWDYSAEGHAAVDRSEPRAAADRPARSRPPARRRRAAPTRR